MLRVARIAWQRCPLASAGAGWPSRSTAPEVGFPGPPDAGNSQLRSEAKAALYQDTHGNPAGTLPFRLNHPAKTARDSEAPRKTAATPPVRTGPDPTRSRPAPPTTRRVACRYAGHIGDGVQKTGCSISKIPISWLGGGLRLHLETSGADRCGHDDGVALS